MLAWRPQVLTKPSLLLNLEGGALFALAILFYQRSHGSWGLFALTFLMPDLFMLGYLINEQIGAALYNLVHTVTAPGIVLAVGALASQPTATALALIWAAHIGFDRLLGFGLKYPTKFQDTHLHRVR